MDLNNVGYRMMGLQKMVDGRQFFGLVQVNNVLRTQNDISDYLMHVSNNSWVRPGMACWYEDTKFLLGTGVTEFNGGPKFRNLRMIEVHETVNWTRVTTSLDPVSKLEKKSATQNLGTALVCRISTSKISDAFRTSDSKFRLITNSLVKPDDRVGNYTITFVETRHGLQYAEGR